MEPIAPIAAFLVLNRLGGLRWAVIGATIASIAVVFARRRRNEALGKVLPIITFAIIARGVIGIITDSETVYFGLGIAGKFAIASVLIGSAAIGRPLAQRGADLLLDTPAEAQDHPAWLAAMRAITVIGGLYYLCSGAIDIFLLERSSTEGYVVLRFITNWPLSLAALALAGILAQRHLAKIPGLAPLPDLLEARLSGLQNPPTQP